VDLGVGPMPGPVGKGGVLVGGAALYLSKKSSPEKQAAVLSTFSEAVAALDSKDMKTAKAKLEEASALDPTDPAVRYYLDKLAAGTSTGMASSDGGVSKTPAT